MLVSDDSTFHSVSGTPFFDFRSGLPDRRTCIIDLRLPADEILLAREEMLIKLFDS